MASTISGEGAFSLPDNILFDYLLEMLFISFVPLHMTLHLNLTFQTTIGLLDYESST